MKTNTENHLKSVFYNMVKTNKELILDIKDLKHKAQDLNKTRINGIPTQEFFLCELFEFYVELKQLHQAFITKLKDKIELPTFMNKPRRKETDEFSRTIEEISNIAGEGGINFMPAPNLDQITISSKHNQTVDEGVFKTLTKNNSAKK